LFYIFLISTIVNYEGTMSFTPLLMLMSVFSGAVRFKVKNNDLINEKW